MKEWFQVSDLKNLIKTCDLSKVEPKDERSLIYFFTRLIQDWRAKEHIPVEVLCSEHKKASEREIYDMFSDPFPITLADYRSQRWPDIAIYSQRVNRKGLIDSPEAVEDWLVAIETKLFRKGSTLWQGIGQAAVNALEYQHSLLVIYDLREKPKETPRKGVVVTEQKVLEVARSRWGIDIIWRDSQVTRPL